MIILKILGLILLAVVLIIAIILILPVRVLIFTDKNNEVKILYKFLWFTFGENPDPNNPILREIKDALGLSKIDSAKKIKANAQQSGVSVTAMQIISILKSLIGRIFWLLKYCKVVKLNITSISADEDAAETAMDYGMACSVIYPLVGYIDSAMKVKKNAITLDLKCDFNAKESRFSVDIILSVTVIYVVRAFFHIVKKNAEKEILKARENYDGKR